MRVLLIALSLISFIPAVSRSSSYEIDVFKDQFVPLTLQPSVRAGTCNTDLQPYLQAAVDSLTDKGGIIFLPTGRYVLNSPLILPGTLARHLSPYTGKPIQLVGASSFLGDVRDETSPSDWSGTTFVTFNSDSAFAFINLNINAQGQPIIMADSTNTRIGWMKGWVIRGIRFDGGATSYKRKAIKGGYITHGLVEDCAFRDFRPPTIGDGGAGAIIDLGYHWDNYASAPYNENLFLNRLKFTRVRGTCIYAGVSNDNLHVSDCYVFNDAQTDQISCFLRSDVAAAVSLRGGIYAYLNQSLVSNSTLLQISHATAVILQSVHCEGFSRIVDTGACNNIEIANSYFQVWNPQFELLNIEYPGDGGYAHNSMAIMGNTFAVQGHCITTMPDDLFLKGVAIGQYPLGVYLDNVAYQDTSPLAYIDVPALRIGKEYLIVDPVTGNVRTAGKVGIGISNPSDRLEVMGRIYSTDGLKTLGDVTAGDANGVYLGDNAYIYSPGNNVVTFAQTAFPGDPDGNMAINAGGFLFSAGTHGSNSEKMRLTADGKLGIGTNAPGAPLDVNGDTRTSRLVDRESTGYFLDLGNAGTAAAFNGSVGIGMTSPSQKLTVGGTIYSTTGGFKFPDGSTQSVSTAIKTGTTNPSSTTPDRIGQIYVNTSTGVVWISTCATGGSCWKQCSN